MPYRRYGRRRRSTRRSTRMRRSTRYPRRMRTSKTYSSNSAGGAALRFKRKTFRPRAYLRNAYKVSEGQTRYRSVNTENANITAPTALGQAVLVTVQAIPDQFNLPIGGLILGGMSSNTDDNWAPHVFVRGGKMTIQFCNRFSNLTNVRIKLWLVYAKNTLPADVVTNFTLNPVPSTFDPTVIFNWWQYIKAPVWTSEKILESGDAWIVEKRIPAFKYPQWQSAQSGYLSKMPFWMFSIEPTQAGVAASVTDVMYGHNLSFSGDTNGITY